MTRVSIRTSPYPVVVVGAGVAGLTAAFRLQEAGVDVQVFEAADRVGGAIHSEAVNGHLFERGPTTVMSTSPHLGRLIDAAGLRPRAIESAPQAGRRKVWRHGRLHTLPEKPPQLLTCSALSLPGRLRLLMEPLVPARRSGPPETLLDMGRRRLGKEATAALLDPFITGVYAGRLDQLGVDAVGRLTIWERAYGSFFKAVKAQRREKLLQLEAEGQPKPTGPPPLVSFPGGLGELPAALGEQLGTQLHTSRRVVSFGRVGAHWRVVVEGEGKTATVMASSILVAAPARIAADLVEPWVGEVVHPFRDIEHPHVATVGLGYRRSDVSAPLDAFGLLVASDSRLEHDVLGVLYVSSIFPDRTPEGEVTLTVMIGGARDPDAAQATDDELVSRARRALKVLIGAEGEPTARLVTRWPTAIPQYPPGHTMRVGRLQSRLQQMGGLQVAGNWLSGVGLEAAVESAELAVDAALRSEWTASRG